MVILKLIEIVYILYRKIALYNIQGLVDKEREGRGGRQGRSMWGEQERLHCPFPF